MNKGFFAQPAELVARELIGATLLVDGVGGRIVETEAYDAADPASHSFGGPTRRNAPMFGPPGRAYVYRIYGLHWCFNMVCDASTRGSAVLIRALEPTIGLDLMQRRRGVGRHTDLCSGPGKLCVALSIGSALNGADLSKPPFEVLERRGEPDIRCCPRIGIRRGTETPWRFGEAGSPYLSRPIQMRAGAA